MRTKLETDSRVRRIATHLTAEVHDESVILHGTEGAYYGLNSTGTRVWQLIADVITVEEIASAMTLDFAASKETLLQDILAVLSELVETGLAEVVLGEAE